MNEDFVLENQPSTINEEEYKKQEEYMKLVEQADREHKCIIQKEDGTYALEEVPLTELDYENAVQSHIDSIAHSKGYDNCYTCLSYLNSTNLQWKQEAEAFNAWRDACWIKCHELLNAFKNGEIAQPSIDEVINQLPVIEW